MTFPNIPTAGLYLEAEVAPNTQQGFETRYQAAIGSAISPGNPQTYQSQNNKWGAELRVYFNDATLGTTLGAHGLTVETHNRGYKSGEFDYRVNNNDFWWFLVESLGATIGQN